jgi:small Trp-rich protein
MHGMVFIIIGVGMLIAHIFGWGPMAEWQFDKPLDLLKFSAPFIAAVVWWLWSDASGLSKRRAMQRDAERKQDRRDRNIEAMGLGHLHNKRKK